MNRVYLSIGANLGDPMRAIQRAAKRIAALPEIHSMRLSSLYRTTPIPADPGAIQPAQPDFLNAACTFETDFTPHDLLNALQEIERELGKRPKGKNDPRPIDLDILLFGEVASSDPRLLLPHPRLLKRLFVLYPLADLTDQITLPGGKKLPVNKLIECVKEDQGKIIAVAPCGESPHQGAEHRL